MERIKLDIVIAEGKHSTEEESKLGVFSGFFPPFLVSHFLFSFPVNKQINDKERVAAAMENPNLKALVNSCIKDQE